MKRISLSALRTGLEMGNKSPMPAGGVVFSRQEDVDLEEGNVFEFPPPCHRSLGGTLTNWVSDEQVLCVRGCECDCKDLGQASCPWARKALFNRKLKLATWYRLLTKTPALAHSQQNCIAWMVGMSSQWGQKSHKLEVKCLMLSWEDEIFISVYFLNFSAIITKDKNMKYKITLNRYF